MELTKLVEGGTHDATILFVVIRGDGERFRPNHEACPSFAKHLKLAQDKGVQILVKRVKWGEASEDIGKCFDDGWIDIEWPL
jgi:DNA-binding sugar fermentation-stimulating protein